MKTTLCKIGEDFAVVVPQALMALLAPDGSGIDIAWHNGAITIRTVAQAESAALLGEDTPVWDD
ncbi:MAG TPA: hypothetical protein VIT92_01100, partial [Burkholderiaceae bacterium]